MNAFRERVSVLIPCYNVADYVADAVRCAVDQTYAPHEILCLDDGSTDGTWGVLQALEREHGGLVRASRGPNRGAPAARNALLEASEGSLIQFLDADDLIRPTKLERQVEIITCEHADVVAGSYRRQLLDGSARTLRVRTTNTWTSLLAGRLGITSSNLWRRSALKACGGWNTAWGSSQEYELLFRLLQQGARVAFDEELLTTVRNREGSISNFEDPATRERYLRLRADIIDHLRAAGRPECHLDHDLALKLFVFIRMLAHTSPEAASELHDRIIPKGFVPDVSVTNTRLYVWSYRFLGFRRAETLKRALRERRRLRQHDSGPSPLAVVTP